MKTIVLIMLFFVTKGSFGQISSGLAVDFDYNSKIKSQQNYSLEMQKAFVYRYTKLSELYKQKVELNNYSTNAKQDPTNGTFSVTATNKWDFMEKREVLVENGVVVKYYNGNNTPINVIDGGIIIRFKTYVKLSNGDVLELIFNEIFKD